MNQSNEAKTVYIGMTADILHHGLINVIEVGRQHGKVVIGLLTDGAVSRYKPLPYLEYEHRKRILENVVGVDEVVPQNERDCAPNLCKLKPDIMVHGDDWCEGPQKVYRDRAIEALGEWGGILTEVPYIQGVSTARYVCAAARAG